MLNGKAVARALRGHFLVENALYALLASNVFGIQLPMEDQDTEFSNDTNEMLDDSRKQQMIGTQSEISQEMAVDSHSDTEEVSSSGNSSSLDQERITELRGMLENLNLLRFRKFANRVMTSSLFVQVYTLPPTSEAAKYHSMRVYHQVQEWTKPDNTLQPKEWGWSLVQKRLPPKKTDLPAAPDNLLKMVKCSCKQNCDTKRCTCRKHGLDCSIGCSECRGMSCTNTSQLTESDLTDAL